MKIRKTRLTITSSETAKVTLTEGKGVKARQSPYTVAFATPFISALKATQRKAKGVYLFDQKRAHHMTRKIKKLLRARDKQYELRSVRRGSLQAMAAAGIDLNTLITFSGHKSMNMLLRYLDWGNFAQQLHEQQIEASTVLWK